MSDTHKQALNDAHELIDVLNRAGWTIMSIGNVHGYSKENADFTHLSFSVERKQNQLIQDA
jgi:hypothetical protein